MLRYNYVDISVCKNIYMCTHEPCQNVAQIHNMHALKQMLIKASWSEPGDFVHFTAAAIELMHILNVTGLAKMQHKKHIRAAI